MNTQKFSAFQIQTSVSADELNNNVEVSSKQLTLATIQAWLVSYLAELLEMESEEIDIKIPFVRYGLDSSAAVGLVGDMETWLNRSLSPTLLYDYPTIEALANNLVDTI
ncbi:acyl carrier protein [Nostoc sp. UHCC 0302]|uniref:acyl carrier protein n=1 Tax=Nostoc sp. UHCC 0302 TaxID=3134896 RepID=UPI00311CB390